MFLTDEEYEHIMAIADGEIQDDIVAELKSWTKEEFGLVVFGYICDKTNGLTRLRIVLWDLKAERTLHDENCFANYDKEKQRKFSEAFARIVIKHNKHPEYHNPEKVFVTYETIRDENDKRTVGQVSGEIERVKELSPDIKGVFFNQGSVYIIYHTDLQVQRHKVDGLDNKIKEYVGQIIKKSDKYGVMPGCSVSGFISQQMLDRRYGGSIINYFH